MTDHKLKSKTVVLESRETLDDIFEKIRTMAALPLALESITILRDTLQFKYWEDKSDVLSPQIETSPDIKSLLSEITVTDVSLSDEDLNVSLDAVVVIAKLVTRAYSQRLSGVGLVVSSVKDFAQWLGVHKIPHRFLDMPVIEYDEIGRYKIVLLAGKARASLPHDAVAAFVGWMESDG